MGQEEGRLFPDLGQQIVEIVRGRGAGQRRDALLVRDVGQKAVVRVVDQLGFLTFLDGFDGQAELFLDLVVRAAVQIGNAGMHIKNGGDGIEEIFTRLLVVIDIGLRQFGFVTLRASDADITRIFDGIQAVDTGLNRQPLQQMHQPARADGGQLGGSLGRIG